MIDTDRDMTKEQKDRQKQAIREVCGYCENKTDCRRSQVLSFFSEQFDSAKCNGGCDVCLHRAKNTYTSEDVTEDAQLMLNMVQSFDREDRITRKNAADCFRGTGGNTSKGLSANEYFGTGKTWKINEAERLVAALVINGGLDEFNIQNAAGYSNSYLKVCSACFR
jgi:bloom syndrome protein